MLAPHIGRYKWANAIPINNISQWRKWIIGCKWKVGTTGWGLGGVEHYANIHANTCTLNSMSLLVSARLYSSQLVSSSLCSSLLALLVSDRLCSSLLVSTRLCSSLFVSARIRQLIRQYIIRNTRLVQLKYYQIQ